MPRIFPRSKGRSDAIIHPAFPFVPAITNCGRIARGKQLGLCWVAAGARSWRCHSGMNIHHLATPLHRVILSGGGLSRRSRRTSFLAGKAWATQRERRYYVYILGSYSGTLYIGVTGNLRRRIWQHKAACDRRDSQLSTMSIRLLYFETYHEVLNAIAREKQLKGMEAGEESRTHRKTESQMGGHERRVVHRR